jgi:hypothetical protein
MGAHPSSSTNWVNLDKHTGKPFPLANEITANGMREILKRYKSRLKIAIQNEKKDRKDEDAETYKMLMEALNGLTVKDIATNYLFTKTGIKFTSDEVLPHVILDMEPNRIWFLSYQQLKIYKSPNSIIIKKLSLN